MPHKNSPRRQLKVYYKCLERGRFRLAVFPEIRLCGQWLDQLGFHTGRQVTVQTSPGCLVITLKGRKPAPLPTPAAKKLPAPPARALPPAARLKSSGHQPAADQ